MQRALNGVEVLLLEDEMLIRICTAEMLQEMGCRVRAFADIPTCLDALKSLTPDVAVLDLKLNGLSYDVADVLDEKGVPVVFLTGYERPAHARWSRHPTCQKPCAADALETILANILGRQG